MIKLIYCLRRLPNLSPTDFSLYWRHDHARLVRTHAATLRIRRYVQSHVSGAGDSRLAHTLDARGASLAPFDGIAELWWDSLADIVAVGATEAGRKAGRTLLADEQRFIDLPNSPICYTTEHEIVGVSETL